MILKPQIFDVMTNDNARYKRNELEFVVYIDNNLRVSILKTKRDYNNH